jgi:hypothetical protein
MLTWYGNRVYLWDLTTGLPRGPLMKHDDLVRGAVFDSTKNRVLS